MSDTPTSDSERTGADPPSEFAAPLDVTESATQTAPSTEAAEGATASEPPADGQNQGETGPATPPADTTPEPETTTPGPAPGSITETGSGAGTEADVAPRSATPDEVGAAPVSSPAPKPSAGNDGHTWAGRSRRPRALLTVGVAALLLATWVAGAQLVARQRSDSAVAAQRPVAVDVAGKVATDLASINATDAAAKLTALSEESTGAFHQQIAPYATELQLVLSRAGSRSTGRVVASGIETIDLDRATVLVLVDAKLGNSQVQDTETIPYRLAVTLSRVGGRWLASGVTFVK